MCNWLPEGTLCSSRESSSVQALNHGRSQPSHGACLNLVFLAEYGNDTQNTRPLDTLQLRQLHPMSGLASLLCLDADLITGGCVADLSVSNVDLKLTAAIAAAQLAYSAATDVLANSVRAKADAWSPALPADAFSSNQSNGCPLGFSNPAVYKQYPAVHLPSTLSLLSPQQLLWLFIKNSGLVLILQVIKNVPMITLDASQMVAHTMHALAFQSWLRSCQGTPVGRLLYDQLSSADCVQAECACACIHFLSPCLSNSTSTRCRLPCFALIWLQTNSWLYQALEAEEAAVQQGTQVRQEHQKQPEHEFDRANSSNIDMNVTDAAAAT